MVEVKWGMKLVVLQAAAEMGKHENTEPVSGRKMEAGNECTRKQETNTENQDRNPEGYSQTGLGNGRG